MLTVLLYSSVDVSRFLKLFQQTKTDLLASAYIKIATVAEDKLNGNHDKQSCSNGSARSFCV